jgi:hypothetical protein
MANEKDLSGHQKFDRLAKTEHFKRSTHNDFATSAELATRKFSGWRKNSITLTYEMWVVGEIVVRVTEEAVAADPLALAKAQINHFGLTPD